MVAEVRTTLHYHEKSKSNDEQRAAAKTLTTARRALSGFNDTDSLYHQIIEINSTSIPDSMQAGGEGIEHAERECGVLSPPSFMGPAGRNGLGSHMHHMHA